MRMPIRLVKLPWLSDYVRICANIGPLYIQGITLAATSQEKTVKEVLYQQQNRDKG